MPTNSPSRSPAEGGAVLIAAQSGRALAAAARRAGLKPYVADLFGDTDTRALAAGYRRVPGRLGQGLAGDAVARALDDLAASCPAPPLGLVLGSGFEASPDLIARLGRRHRLLGSPAEAVRTLKDPFRFAALLGRLGIPHPPVAGGAVPDPANWLLKRAGGSGGGHIRPSAAGARRPGFYRQRRVPGSPVSLAFLADGRAARGFAVTAQWVDPSPGAPFRYGGAVDPGACAPAVRAGLERAADAITAATGLRGLASLDALAEGDSWWLLEINPRPGATLDVLDRRPTPLLLQHVEACLGRLPEPEAAPGAAASAIVYAGAGVAAAPAFDWPDHVLDRPEPASRIPAGAPLCTVVAAAADRDAALALLNARIGPVRDAFHTGDLAHAPAHQPAERQPPRGAAR
jgi:uncharacterized protein